MISGGSKLIGTQPRAVVVGGSLGGLNAALWLREAGWQVDVFEREAEGLVSRGAGIVVQPATIRYFQEHDGPHIDELAVAAQQLRWVDGEGDVVFEEEPCPYTFTSWNVLYRHYLAAFGDENYHTGEALLAMDQDEDGVSTTFATGRIERADLLVCSDGIGSTARSMLLPDVSPSYAGYVAWRGLLDERTISAELRSLMATCTYRQMSNSQVIVYPVPGHAGSTASGSRLLNWLWYRNVPEGSALDDLLTDVHGQRRGASVPPGFVQQRHIHELQQLAEEQLPDQLGSLVAATDEPFLQTILDLRSPRMAFGRVALIGDAAFAARPHAGAGTAKAAEDAWVLAGTLTHVDPNDVPDALTTFERQQLPLGRQLVDRAARAGNLSQFDGHWDPADPSLRMGLHPTPAPQGASVSDGVRVDS